MNKVYHKYIDLSVLPVKNNRIDWKNSIGKEIYFEYNDHKGYITVLGKDNEKDGRYVKILYNNKVFSKQITDIKRVNLGILVGSFNGDYHFEIGDTIKDDKKDITILDREYRNDKNGKRRKWYKCNNCGWDNNWREEKHVEDKNICPCCTGHITIKGINDIATTDP